VVAEKWELSVDNPSDATATITIDWKDTGIATLYAESELTVATVESDDLGTFLSSHDELQVTLTSAASDLVANPVVVRVTAGPERGGVNAGGYGGYARGDGGTTWDAAGFEVLADVT
jgi:hypothetical protein